MEVKEIVQKAYIFDEEERKKLLLGLEYLNHRVCKHETTGTAYLVSRGVTAGYLQYLIKQMAYWSK